VKLSADIVKKIDMLGAAAERKNRNMVIEDAIRTLDYLARARATVADQEKMKRDLLLFIDKTLYAYWKPIAELKID
jgi:predicted transcriptional regulator